MDRVKQILAALLFIVTGAFLFERSRAKSAEAVADNKEVLDKINEGDKVLAKNDGLKDSEEQKRQEIAKESEDAKKSTDGDADFFNSRK